MNYAPRNACKCRDIENHTNAFLTLNGIPYLLAEYLDHRSLMPIDSSSVRSEINIDQTDCMQTVIDIQIDDIGKDSKGNLNTIGNKTKLASLYNIIQNNSETLGNQLPVVRRGLILQINYQLENQRTGQVLRSMVENVRVYDRSFFIAVNRHDHNDNSIVVNFSNSMISTVNHFTNGTDPMILRITNIQMFYERVKRHDIAPHVPKSLITDPELAQYFYGNDADLYKYHQKLQAQHVMSSGYGNEILDSGIPGSWGIFDRFYHFDIEAKDIIIHDQEVYDPRAALVKIPCGTVAVGRSFVVNPGTRLVFKVCVWKNDLVIVNDANEIAKRLRAPISSYCPGPKPPKPDYGCPMMQNQQGSVTDTDYAQNAAINQIAASVNELTSILDSMCDVSNEGSNHVIPTLPERPEDDPTCPHYNPPYGPDCRPCPHPPAPFPPVGPDKRHIIGKLAKRLKDLQGVVQSIEENGVYQDDLSPFPLDIIKEIVQQAADNTDGIDDPVDPDTPDNNEP